MSDNSSNITESITPFVEQELRSGKSRDAIFRELVAAGWDSQQVRTIVDQTPAPAPLPPVASDRPERQRPRTAQDEEARAYGIRKMKSGAAWCLGGILVTAISIYAAANTLGGGSYFLAWGAILFGAVDFLHGWAIYRGK